MFVFRMQAPPPRSLQELLERQWEQTAQFILDQAGKQNNGECLVESHVPRLSSPEYNVGGAVYVCDKCCYEA